MNILLVNPPCGPRTIGMRHISRIEPLGLETIGAAVSEEHDVRLVDMLVRPRDLLRTLKRFKPDVVGATCESVRARQAVKVLRTVREIYPDCLTVVGGHHPTLYPQDFDDPAVDLVVRGEGIESFAQICETRCSGSTCYEHIAGIMIRTPEGLKPTAHRPPPTSLDNQPMADRSLTAPYRKHYYYIMEPHVAGMRTSFGCPYRCSFCPSMLYCQGQFVMRDPEMSFEEIRSIREPFIYFCDTGSFHDVERMTELAERLLRAGVKKRYLSYARADNVVRNPELFKLWARAGLTLAMIGLEALDEEALVRYEKGTHISTNERAVRFLEKIGVSITGGFVVEPTAGPEYFERIDNYVRTHPSIVHAEFTPLTPFPGTKYFEQEKNNVVTDDWEVYDMQHFVVKTQLPTKELYEMIVRSYRKIVFNVMRRERLWLPLVGVTRGKWRLLRGLLASSAALAKAHTHIQAIQTEGAKDLAEKSRSHREAKQFVDA